LIVRANDKATLWVIEQEEPVIETPAKMCRVTFDQLVAPRPTVSPIEPVEEVSQAGLSDVSKRILRTSRRTKDIEKLPLEKRERVLTQMKNDAIQKLEMAHVDDERKEM
jgi:hypothetical protein